MAKSFLADPNDNIGSIYTLICLNREGQANVTGVEMSLYQAIEGHDHSIMAL